MGEVIPRETWIGLDENRGLEALRVTGGQEREILTPQEAADFLRVPLLTVQRQVKSGPATGKTGGKGMALLSEHAPKWVASGPDRHDLKLYDPRQRGRGRAARDHRLLRLDLAERNSTSVQSRIEATGRAPLDAAARPKRRRCAITQSRRTRRGSSTTDRAGSADSPRASPPTPPDGPGQ